MKLLPSRPDSASQAFNARRSVVPVQAPAHESTRLAFFARMAVYSRSLPSDPQSTSTSNESSDIMSTSIPTKTIIAGVLGAVAVLLACLGIFIVVRLRYRRGPGLSARFPWSTSGTESGTASSQRTLCNSEGRFVVSKTAQTGVMKGKASFMSERSQLEFKSTPSVEEDIAPIDYLPRRTHSKRRPTIMIDTAHLPSKYRTSSTGSPSCFRETKGDITMAPLSESDFDDEAPHRESMLSTYTLSLQLSRPPTSLSQVSVQTVSPIAFCDAPSNSHLPLALRPKNVMPATEQDQPDSKDSKHPTASPPTSV